MTVDVSEDRGSVLPSLPSQPLSVPRWPKGPLLLALLFFAASCATTIAFKDARTPSGESCMDMLVIPAGQKADQPYRRMEPIQTWAGLTEADRLESLRREACRVGADAVVDGAHEERRDEQGVFRTVTLGVAVLWETSAAPAPKRIDSAQFGASVGPALPLDLKEAQTPAGDFCADMPIVPAGQDPERPFHRMGPIHTATGLTEVQRLESLRRQACDIGADAIVEAVDEDFRDENGVFGKLSSGTAALWVGFRSEAEARSARELLRRAEALVDSHKYAEAEAAFAASWKLERSWETACYFGFLEQDLKSPDRAFDLLRFAVKHYPADGNAGLRGHLNWRFAQTKQQLAAAEQERRAEDAKDFADQADYLYGEGKLEEAEKQYEDAWKLHRTYLVAGNLGMLEADLKKPQRAAELLEFAVREFPPGGNPSMLESFKRRLDEVRGQLATPPKADAGVPRP